MVLMSMHIQSNWKGFLSNDENKSELFQLLAVNLVSLKIPEGMERMYYHL